MSSKTANLVTLWSLVALSLTILIVVLLNPKPNQGLKDAAAVFTLVTISAVAIERVLELFWTVVSESFFAKFWPLRELNAELEKLEQGVGAAVPKEFFDNAEKAIKGATHLSEGLQSDLVAKLNADKAAFDEQLARLQQLAPTNQRLQLITTASFQAVALAQKKYQPYAHKVQYGATVAQQALTGVADFVTSVKDNPGRRIVSIYGGVLLGIAAAGVAGLDLFGASSAPSNSAPSGSLLGIILTGALMGLGAGPTHTVIGVLQEIRKARGLDTAASPTNGGGGGGGGMTDGASARADGRAAVIVSGGASEQPSRLSYAFFQPSARGSGAGSGVGRQVMAVHEVTHEEISGLAKGVGLQESAPEEQAAIDLDAVSSRPGSLMLRR